ncbi:MAG: TlpA family protein disulfide reductase [Alistipes sp.]|nr:TlpA family protein disulfide reductase [Alistipes sp.]
MKYVLNILAIIIAAGSYAQELTRFNVNVPDSMQVNGRKAFLFVFWENNASLLDSCIIHNNAFVLKADIPYDEISAEILIAGLPNSSGQILSHKGDDIYLTFAPNGKYRRPFVCGSKAHEELYAMINHPISIRRKTIQTELRKMNQSADSYSSMRDSVTIYLRQEDKLWKDLLYNTTSGYNAIFAFHYIQQSISPEEINDIKTYLTQKFADNINISTLTNRTINGEEVPKMSNASKNAYNRYATIIGDVPPYPDIVIKHKDHSTAKMYNVGDIVEDFEFPSVGGNNINLSDLHTEYILIDFWASWCSPCIKAMPDLKEIASNNPNLAILAISIDKNINQWKHAIKQHNLRDFVHVILRSNHPDYDYINTRFDIKKVPTNLLLNKEHQIIAFDVDLNTLKTIIDK